MKKRIFSMVLALVFACMPTIGVCASPETVGVETAEETALQSELQKEEDFTEQITACKEKLSKIDKKLGVDKK